LQIEERNIELEGTRAQLRVMEYKTNRSEIQQPHLDNSSSSNITDDNQLSSKHDGITIMHTSTPSRLLKHSQMISTPSMQAMTPLVMDEVFQHSSSTESAQDQQERELTTCMKYPETPKRSRPSKIPLPGSMNKSVVAKPPSGRPTSTIMSASAGPPSNRSLTKSTSSLTRPDSSVQSWRNLSLEGKSRSSSIPISNKPTTTASSTSPNTTTNYGSPTMAFGATTVIKIPPPSPSSTGGSNSKYVASSPLPRSKRDSLTTKVKHLDSLSRLQSSSTGILPSSGTTSALNSPSNQNHAVTNGTNSNRKYTALPVRRASNVSVGRDTESTEQNGGKVRTIRSSIWNWLKI